MATETKYNIDYWNKRFLFLQKRWLLYLFVPLAWIAILCLRDFLFGKKSDWIGCIFFYLIKTIFYTIHYLCVKNCKKEELFSIIQNYIGRFPILQLTLYALFIIADIIFLLHGKPEGIPIYTSIFCSGIEDVYEYLELKRVFDKNKDCPKNSILQD